MITELPTRQRHTLCASAGVRRAAVDCCRSGVSAPVYPEAGRRCACQLPEIVGEVAVTGETDLTCYSARRFDADRNANPLRYLDSRGQICAPNNNLGRLRGLTPYTKNTAIPDVRRPVPSIYSIVPPNDGSALRHGHHFEPVDFVIDHGRGHHDAYSAGSCQRTYARACGCRQRPRCHREELIESERGWSGREAFVTMMQTADLGQGNDRSGPGRLNGSSIRCVLAERQVGP